jgi:hypothetical protein
MYHLYLRNLSPLTVYRKSVNVFYFITYQHDALFFFTLLPYHVSTCFGPFVVHHKEAKCIMWPPDDGLQMGPKHVEAWQRNEVKK